MAARSLGSAPRLAFLLTCGFLCGYSFVNPEQAVSFNDPILNLLGRFLPGVFSESDTFSGGSTRSANFGMRFKFMVTIYGLATK